MTNIAKIDRSKARKTAGEYLARRDKQIELKKEIAIQEEMSGWWFPAKTREDAIKRLQNDSNNSWYWIESQGGYWADKARQVILLCDNSKEAHVYLDDETVEFLFKEPNVI